LGGKSGAVAKAFKVDDADRRRKEQGCYGKQDQGSGPTKAQEKRSLFQDEASIPSDNQVVNNILEDS
jgi:hypothetical protein